MVEDETNRLLWDLRVLDRWQLSTARGDTVAVPLREQRLLGLLALRGLCGRGDVARVLWPDSDEARARASLRAAVWWLHHHVGDVVTTSGGCLALGRSVAVDLREVRSHLGLTAHQPPAGSLAAIDALSFAELLPGWEDGWVCEERTLLHQLRLRALEAGAEAALQGGDTTTALLAATRAVGLDPFRESARRALVRVHLHEGNYADALREYDAFAEVLRRELGVRVSAELQQLVAPLRCPQDSPVTQQ